MRSNLRGIVSQQRPRTTNSGCPPIVRVGWCILFLYAQRLDNISEGIMFPADEYALAARCGECCYRVRDAI